MSFPQIGIALITGSKAIVLIAPRASEPSSPPTCDLFRSRANPRAAAVELVKARDHQSGGARKQKRDATRYQAIKIKTAGHHPRNSGREAGGRESVCLRDRDVCRQMRHAAARATTPGAVNAANYARRIRLGEHGNSSKVHRTSPEGEREGEGARARREAEKGLAGGGSGPAAAGPLARR